MADRREDFLFAEHVLRHDYVTDAQVRECHAILAKLRDEMELDESLANVLEKKGYLSRHQRRLAERSLDPAAGAANGNAIPGYQLLERIGFGAMGSVYKARHLDLDILVAVKVLRASLASSRTQVERLKREARLVARLTHPNIVLSRDVGEADGMHYLVMELVDGDTVRAHVDKGPMPEAEALRVTLETARALEHAHAHGVIHRDVKPGNIMIAKDGSVKLADFGLARGKAPSDLTMEHASLGTPQYVAPEQMRRAADATPRSDLFGLGASLYHMVTGQPPFQGDSLGEIVQKVMVCEFAPPEKVNPDLSHDTLYLIHRLMQADPARRHQSATNVVRDLERLAKGESIAPGSFRGDHAAYLRQRRKKMALIGGSIAVLTLTLGAWAFFAWRKGNEQRALDQRCAVLNRTGKRASPASAEAVRQLAEKSRRAWVEASGAGCERGTVRDLDRLRNRARVDAETLGEAEKTLAAVVAEGTFSKYHRQVRTARDKAHFDATKARLEQITRRIADDSEKAADRHWRRVLDSDYESATAGLSAMRGFRDAQRDRYVGGRGGPDGGVGDLLTRYETLTERWKQIDDGYGARLDKAERDREWSTAQATLKTLLREKGEALEKVEDLSGNMLRFFRIPDDDESRLLNLERAEFKSVTTRVAQLADRGDVTAALKHLKDFADRAFDRRPAAAKFRESIRQSGSTQERQERELLDRLEAGIEDALKGRRWSEPGVLLKAVKDGDVLHFTARLKRLRARARQFERLHDRLGGNPGPSETADALRKRLKLDDKLMRGHFEAGEAFACRHDHRRAVAYLDSAVKALGEEWGPGLRAERKRRERAQIKDEADADTLRRQVNKDDSEQRYTQAVVSLNLLLSRYRFTDVVSQNRKDLDRIRKRLETIAGDEVLRWRAGLPATGFTRRAESGDLELTFTFQEWWPAEASANATDPLKERNEIRERLLKSNGHATAAERARAAHQLSLFSTNLLPDATGAIFRAPATEEEARGANAWRRAGTLKPVTWTVPGLDMNKNWSVEVTVSWEGGDPGYFVLAAGRHQGGILYAPELAGRGGGQAARLFEHDALTGSKVEKWLKEAMDKGGGPGRRKALSKLPGFKMKPGQKIRLRLTRAGRTAILQLFDGAGKNAAPVVELQQRIGKKPGAGGFRFASLRRFRFHKVVVQGWLIR